MTKKRCKCSKTSRRERPTIEERERKYDKCNNTCYDEYMKDQR